MKFRSDMGIALVDSMGGDDSVIRAMMVSTRGAESIDASATAGRVRFLMANRHGTPFEHATMTFLVEAPIAVFREWHRHRVGISYNEESGRYKKTAPVFYEPPPERPLVQVGKPGQYTFVAGDATQHERQCARIRRSCSLAYELYEEALADGVCKEVARGILPVYTYSSMYVTFNPRSLMHFLSLRSTAPDAHFPSFPMWEIEQCALQLEHHFAELFPLTHTAFRTHGSVPP